MNDAAFASLKEQVLELGQGLRDAITRLSEKPENWRSTLSIDLGANILQSIKLVLEGYDGTDTTKCALGTRNLLELSLWISYASTNEQRARRLYEDAICDQQDLINKLAKYDSSHAAIKAGQEQLDALLPLMKQVGAGDKFLKVADVARELGVYVNYDIANKFVSKFVHPSSLSIQIQKLPDGRKIILSVLLELCTTLTKATIPALTTYVDAS